MLFLANERVKVKAALVGVERTWGGVAGHCVIVDKRTIMTYDINDAAIHPDFDELKRVGLAWDNILATSAEMKAERARRAS